MYNRRTRLPRINPIPIVYAFRTADQAMKSDLRLHVHRWSLSQHFFIFRFDAECIHDREWDSVFVEFWDSMGLHIKALSLRMHA